MQEVSSTVLGNQLMMQQAVKVFTMSTDPVAKQNSSGMLGYLASTRPDFCSMIARSEGVGEAVEEQLAPNCSHDMQHNAALLLGQLARASVAFRRRFAGRAQGMASLVSLLICSDTDTVCNTLWALRSLVEEGTHRDPLVRRQTAAMLKPLTKSPDARVVVNAEALCHMLRRPCPIDTTSDVDDEAAVLSLASILHTPPPCAAPRAHHLGLGDADNCPSRAPRKRKNTLGSVYCKDDNTERMCKRLDRTQRDVFEDESDADIANETYDEEPNSGDLGALAFLIQAAEG